MLINIYKSLTFQLFWEKTFIKNQRLLVGFYADMISFISRCLSVVFLFSKTFDTDHGNAYCYLFLFIESLTGCGILMTELIFVTEIMIYIQPDKNWHVEKFWRNFGKFCHNLRAFMWRKIEPKSTFVENKWQIWGLTDDGFYYPFLNFF